MSCTNRSTADPARSDTCHTREVLALAACSLMSGAVRTSTGSANARVYFARRLLIDVASREAMLLAEVIIANGARRATCRTGHMIASAEGKCGRENTTSWTSH